MKRLPFIPEFVSIRPVITLTGFLGAGKTTLLRELLVAIQAEGLKSDVILNDYVDASMDSATLEQFTQTIEPLSATCACCEGLDFLLELAMKSSKAKSDVLFVELNGTADPVPIVESFTLLEDKLQLHPRWQICVIDTRHFGQRGKYTDIEELQLQTASHIYFTHSKQKECNETLLEKVRSVNAYASVVDQARLRKMVIELAKQAKKNVLIEPQKLKPIDLSKVKKAERHQLTHAFTSCKILMPTCVNEQDIRKWLAILPPSVIRVKLLIGVAGKLEDERYLFERVGMEISRYPQRVKLGRNVPNSAILIGPNLNITELETLAKQYLKKVIR